MAGDDRVIQVHSVAEAYLYLKVAPCAACGKGLMRAKQDLTKSGSVPGGWTMTVACSACQDERSLCFSIRPAPTREQARSQVINPTSDRSSAIDLLGWLTLFQTILEASAAAAGSIAQRDLAYEAALCLDEAMKFYDGDEELPNEGAFFSESTKRRFREHPQHFARSKWRERRLKLPDAGARTVPADAGGKRSWWRFWRR